MVLPVLRTIRSGRTRYRLNSRSDISIVRYTFSYRLSRVRFIL